LPEGVELASAVEKGEAEDHSVASILAPKKPQSVESEDEVEEGETDAADESADAE